MSQSSDHDREDFAAIVQAEMADVVEELHAIDPVDLVSYIRFGRFAAIEDLLQSSTELFFKEGSLNFGWTAAVDMAWDELPTVTLGMEFTHQTVSVFFNLALRAMTQSVEVASILFDPVCPDPRLGRLRLLEAFADAHLPKRRLGTRPGGLPRGGRPMVSR